MTETEQQDKRYNAVRETVWPWEKSLEAKVPNRTPSIKKKITVQMTVMSIIAALFFYFDHTVMGWVIVGLALFFLCLAFTSPKAYRSVDAAFLTFGLWVGVALTHIMLVPFFYLCFLPARLILMARKSDPMRLAFPSPQPSCWNERTTPPRQETYKRQY